MTEATQEQQKAVTSDVDKHKTNQHEGTTSQIDQQDVEQQAPPTSEFERPTANQEAAKENEKAATPDIEQHREEQDASQLPNEAGETEGNQHEGTTSQNNQLGVEQQAPPTSEVERPTADKEAAKEKEKPATPDVEQHREEQDASQLPNEEGETEGKTEIYYYYFFIFYLIFFMGLIFESGERYLLENSSYVSEPDVPTPKSKRIKKIAIRRV